MNLFKKFIQFSIGNGVVLLLGFISSPIITRIIDPNEMGKFSMFNTVTNLLLVFVLLGIDQSYVRYYYDEEEDNRRKLLRECLRIPLIANSVVGILIIIFFKPISEYIIDEKSIKFVILLIIHLILSTISRFAMLQVRMKQRANFYSILNIISKFSYLILIGILLKIYNNNYLILVLATIISNALMGLIAIIFEKKEWFNLNRDSKIKVKRNEIIKYGIPFVFSMAITWIFQSIDRVSIKEFCGYGEVGLYSGAMNIISLLNAFQGAFSTFWTPIAYERYNKDSNDKEFFSKVNKIVSIIMLFIAIILITAKDFIVLLLGEKYREAAFIFPYLVFMPIMYTISETTVLGINFKKKTKSHIYIAIISAVFNLIGNLILVPKYGAKGAAISTGIAYIIFFISRTYISNRYYKVNYSLGKFAIATTFTYILATYSSFNKFNSIILLLSTVLVSTIILLYKEEFNEGIKFIRNSIKRLN